MYHNLAHLNGNLLCAIDTETTGLDFEMHDIYELAIIPLNDKLERDSTRSWLDLRIIPSRAENIGIGRKKKSFNQSKIDSANDTGLNSESAQEILDKWFEKMNLGRCKLAPVGCNYAFDSRFLRAWLGDMNYESKFADYETRDVQVMARFMNDLADYRGESSFPFPKVNLQYLASTLKVDRDYGKAHTALADAAMTADVYRKMVNFMNLKMLQ